MDAIPHAKPPPTMHPTPPPYPRAPLHAFARHPYPGARQIVESETRGSGLIGCLLFALMPLGVLAGIVGLIAAVLMTDYRAEYAGGGFVALIIILAVPWVVHLVRKTRKVRAILARMPCPHCHQPTGLRVDGPTNRYQLVCNGCQVIWQTEVAAPSSRSHH